MAKLTSFSLSERILISSSYLSSFSEYCENNKHSWREVVATIINVYENCDLFINTFPFTTAANTISVLFSSPPDLQPCLDRTNGVVSTSRQVKPLTCFIFLVYFYEFYLQVLALPISFSLLNQPFQIELPKISGCLWRSLTPLRGHYISYMGKREEWIRSAPVTILSLRNTREEVIKSKIRKAGIQCTNKLFYKY